MPYHKDLEFPDLEKKQDGTCTYTHNHAYKYGSQTRELVKAGKKEIKSCVFFAKNCLKNDNLTGAQKVILMQSIRNDEDLIKSLNDEKPPRCTII